MNSKLISHLEQIRKSLNEIEKIVTLGNEDKSIEDKIEFILNNSSNRRTIDFVSGVKGFMDSGRSLTKAQVDSINSTYNPMANK